MRTAIATLLPAAGILLGISLAAGGGGSPPEPPRLGLLVTEGDVRNVVVARGGAWLPLTRFDRPRHVYGFAASPDGRLAYVWWMDYPPRKLSLFDLETREETCRFRPGYGGELRWTDAGTLLHTWRCGTSCESFRVYDREGARLFEGAGDSLSASPSGRYLATLPIVAAGPRPARVFDLVRGEMVAWTDRGLVQSVEKAVWEEERRLFLRFLDGSMRERTTRIRLP